MKKNLKAGFACLPITSRPGLSMAGWASRAAGDNIIRYVHDDIHVTALCVEAEKSAFAVVSLEISAVDPVATGIIRAGIAERTGLSPESIMVCATHCHSAPVFCPIARACSDEDMKKNAINGKSGSIENSWKRYSVTPGVSYGENIDQEWRSEVIAKTIDTAVCAWNRKTPVVVAYGEAEISGIASSRRVLLKDGTLADPRQRRPEKNEISSVTTIDPFIRNIFFREQDSDKLVAVLTNYGSHPWLFSIAGISAELSGATCSRIRETFNNTPGVIYTTGPEGDISNIWNLDIENLWLVRPGESSEESLARRERAYTKELARLAGIMVDGVKKSFAGIKGWSSDFFLDTRQVQVKLPLKQGYFHLPEVLVADWQKAAGSEYHVTEAQLFQIGDTAILGLPGEPFCSLGMALRERLGFRNLVIVTLANDFGAISYIPDRAAYDQGGYEPAVTPLAPGSGEIMVEQVARLKK